MKKPTPKLRLPNHIELAGVKVAIRYRQMDDTFGEYHSNIRTIYVSQLAMRDAKTLLDTIKHEARHAILDLTGLAHLVRYEEEAIVRCMENLLDPAWDRFLTKYKP